MRGERGHHDDGPRRRSGRRPARGALAVAVLLIAAVPATAGPYTIPDAELAANFVVEWGAATHNANACLASIMFPLCLRSTVTTSFSPDGPAATGPAGR